MRFSVHKYLPLLLLLALLMIAGVAQGQQGKSRSGVVDYDARQFEVVNEGGKQVIYLIGDVAVETESGFIYCDSAVLRPGERIRLKGRVRIDDPSYRLWADSVVYRLDDKTADAWGEAVRLWSFKDSLFAIGTHAFLNQDRKYFLMDHRPTLFIYYPDSSRMVEVRADRLEYTEERRVAEATGEVQISSPQLNATAGCATLNPDKRILDLYESPVLLHGDSRLSGNFIAISMDAKVVRQVDVVDSAEGFFREVVDSVTGRIDEAKATADFLRLMFVEGELDSVICLGNAYSWYNPAPGADSIRNENWVSGETIAYALSDRKLERVRVLGEAIGEYRSTRPPPAGDSAAVTKVDSVSYEAREIEYRLADSLITLSRDARVHSGAMSLEAQLVKFDTKRRVVEAFAARSKGDSAETADSTATATLQPVDIPVTLTDKNESLLGDYLEYSLETEKGRLVQSKTSYEQGFYYSRRLYREQKEVFYADDGRYTTCELGEPHFHFYSSRMKLIRDDKLIARPVVFYLGRLPLVALPYYVFPLKRGRHSGILPLEFGQFQRERRYIRNLGYYWAASPYWDWQGSLDYYEAQKSINIHQKVNFAKRYVLSGYLAGDITLQDLYDRRSATEGVRRRWTLSGAYTHKFTPDFEVRSYGSFQSDASYFTDLSSNLDERLNRVVKSQASFTKRFSRNVALSGTIDHTKDLDKDTRTVRAPDLSLTLPTIYPFGGGGTTTAGNPAGRSWIQETKLTYSPRLTTLSSASNLKTDSLGAPYRSRKGFSRIDHNPQVTLPSIDLLSHFTFTPRLNYSESWYKIFPTGASDSAGIDASETYRTWSYGGSIGFVTNLYGTLTPRLWKVQAMRHTMTPSLSYSYIPELNRHPVIRQYAGGGAGSSGEVSSIGGSLRHAVQAKIGDSAQVASVDLLTASSSFSYNVKAETRKLSDISTDFQSSTLKIFTFSGRFQHTFYRPGGTLPELRKVRLVEFSTTAGIQLQGSRFLFDPPSTPGGTVKRDTLATRLERGSIRSGSGWRFSAQYGYAQSNDVSGRRTVSNHFISYSLGFNMTPTTTVNYNQRYDFSRESIISSSVSIDKKLHCWQGSLYWVPVGSNRGFGFRLSVIALPEIKIDDRYDNFLDGINRR